MGERIGPILITGIVLGTPKGFDLKAQVERRLAAKPWEQDVHSMKNPEGVRSIHPP